MNSQNIFGIIVCCLLILSFVPYLINPIVIKSERFVTMSFCASIMTFLNALVFYQHNISHYDNYDNYDIFFDLIGFILVSLHLLFTTIHFAIYLNKKKNNNNYNNYNNYNRQYYALNNSDERTYCTDFLSKINHICCDLYFVPLIFVIMGLAAIYTCLVTFMISCHIDDGQEKGICFSWARLVAAANMFVIICQYIIKIKEIKRNNETRYYELFHPTQYIGNYLIVLYLLTDNPDQSTVIPYITMCVGHFLLYTIFLINKKHNYQEHDDINIGDDLL